MPRYDLDATLIRWGEPHSFQCSTAHTGCIAFGVTGSGKSSGILELLRTSYLTPSPAIPGGMAAVIFLAKTGELRDWLDLCARCGRSNDVVVFEPGGKETFDFCAYESSYGRQGAGQVQNTVLQLSELSVIAQRASGAQEGGRGGDGPYWERTLQHYILSLVLLLVTAREPVTIVRMAELGASAPFNAAQFASREWMNESPLGRFLGRLAAEYAEEKDPERRADIDLIFQFWTQWSSLDGKPRGICEGMWKTLSTHFMLNPLRSVFASGTSTTTPDDVLGKNKVVIVNFPMQEFKAAGAIAAQIWKYNLQKAIMRRSGPRGSLHPCAIIADEFQNFVTPSDAEFASVARSSGGCILYLTQTINSLRRVLGRETTDVLLSNLRTKFFAQSDGETAQVASDLCGSRYVWVTGTSDGGSISHDERGGPQGGGGNSSVSRHQQLRPYLLPSRLLALRDGGALNHFEIDTCVMSGGRTFAGEKGERVPFKVLTFKQRV